MVVVVGGGGSDLVSMMDNMSWSVHTIKKQSLICLCKDRATQVLILKKRTFPDVHIATVSTTIKTGLMAAVNSQSKEVGSLLFSQCRNW